MWKSDGQTTKLKTNVIFHKAYPANTQQNKYTNLNSVWLEYEYFSQWLETVPDTKTVKVRINVKNNNDTVSHVQCDRENVVRWETT